MMVNGHAWKRLPRFDDRIRERCGDCLLTVEVTGQQLALSPTALKTALDATPECPGRRLDRQPAIIGGG